MTQNNTAKTDFYGRERSNRFSSLGYGIGIDGDVCGQQPVKPKVDGAEGPEHGRDRSGWDHENMMD